jgi:ABC-type sugar transport system substrate-binding protein
MIEQSNYRLRLLLAATLAALASIPYVAMADASPDSNPGPPVCIVPPDPGPAPDPVPDPDPDHEFESNEG